MADVHIGFGTPWQAQIDFLLAKLRLPTERWDDIQKSAHDRAFIVAGAAKADLLADLQQAVVDNASKGTAAFARDFKAIVAKHGWTGWTGEGTPEGEAWRARVIYQTNMRTSYMAARYQQLKANAEDLPYWEYVHSDSARHPRPMHVSWDGLILPHDHPFWDTHFPPNGWGCMCNVIGVSRRKGEAAARGGRGTPPAGWDTINPATGAPPGIDKGWGYAPGASVKKSLQSFVAKKLIQLDAGTGALMWQALGPSVLEETESALAAMVDRITAKLPATGETLLFGAIAETTVMALGRLGIELENAAIWLHDQDLLHGMRSKKAERNAALDTDVLKAIPNRLQDADSYFDLKRNAVIYVFDLGPKVGKVPIRINYKSKFRTGGERFNDTSNFVATSGMADYSNMNDATNYLRLK